MRNTLQFEFSVSEIGIDERLSDSLVTKTEDQKKAICRLCRNFSEENVLIGEKSDIFPMFTTLYTSEKCFFLRVHDSVENCIKTVHNFCNSCMKKVDINEKVPIFIFLFFIGSDEFRLLHQSETMESILTVPGINHDEMELELFLKIDEIKVKPNNMEVSVIISLKKATFEKKLVDKV